MQALMQVNSEGSERDLADDHCRRCKKGFPSSLSCIGKKTKEGCDHYSCKFGLGLRAGFGPNFEKSFGANWRPKRESY